MDLVSFASLNGAGSGTSSVNTDLEESDVLDKQHSMQPRHLQQKFWRKLTAEGCTESMDQLARHAHVGEISQADPHSSLVQRKSIIIHSEEGDSMFGEEIPFDELEEALQIVDHNRGEKPEEVVNGDGSFKVPKSDLPRTTITYINEGDSEEEDMFGDDIPLDETDETPLKEVTGSPSSACMVLNKDMDTLENNKYVRYMVANVTVQRYIADDHTYPANEKILLLLDQKLSCPTNVRLREAWVETVVTVGDIVHIPSVAPGTTEIIIDNKNNLLIVHPDHLVSCTTVAESIFCRRKSVLQQKIKSLSEYSEPLVYGDIMHRILQDLLRSGDFSVIGIRDAIERIVMSSLDALFALDQTESSVINLFNERIPDIKAFGDIYVGSEPNTMATISNDIGPNAAAELGCTSVAISRVLDIEEHLWSPTYGLKGMIDASIELKLSPTPKVLAVPFELKTGKANRFISHRAQTMLYTLLMSDRYDVDVATGALFYSRTNSLYLVLALHAEVRSLMIARNSLATAMKKGQGLPPMIKNIHSCQHCNMSDACLIYHKSVDNGTSESSGLHKWFDNRTSHISNAAGSFFRHWQHLIDLEEDDIDNIRKDIWSLPSDTREMTGKCFDNMVLDLAQDLAANRTCTFRKDSTLVDEHNCNLLLLSHISVGDPVVISSMEGHVNLSMGFVASLDKQSITVKLQSPLRNPPRRQPNFNEKENQAFLSSSQSRLESSEVRYRIDKDEMAGGMALMRRNLITLLASEESGGDTKRRRLIVDRAMPSFCSPKSAKLPKLPGLNPDQRNAIEKVLSAQDYTLILGMPGTGKTTTTAWLIKTLVEQNKSVLLTAYTHTALDNVLLKVRESGIDVLRLGNPDKALEEFCNSKQVVGTTCLGIGHHLFRKRKFDYCIVDEASQITLPACIGPLYFADVFVLVGDQYQLPPVIRNNQAREGGLVKSLFTLLAEAHPQAVVFLEYQYRMNKEIMSVSNTLIYDNKLKCGNEWVASRSLTLSRFSEGMDEIHKQWQDKPDSSKKCMESRCWLQKILDPSSKVVFVDTDALSADEERLSGNQLQNPTEANLILQTAESLLACGVREEQIAVVSVYRSQLRLISRQLAGRQDLEIATIDKYQGRDKDCVLVSLVRSNAHGNAGDLLKDWRRLNVAFTRAKCKLVVFGSVSTLEMVPIYSHICPCKFLLAYPS
ncbi:Tripartite DNA replication factor [Apophysomyces sp. BC1015]|nr:Tripartite DNA replication factor [Apophysomyces sp. BC1015]